MMYQKNNDDTLYEYVFEEIEQGIEPVKSLWARAVALSEGNNNKAKSLYMQYRVQAIKDQLSILQIDIADLSKEELFELIKNGFTTIPEKLQIIKEQKAEAKEKAIKIAIEEEKKQEAEEYGKFGGWLLIFAIFLVVGNLFAFRDVGAYFQNEFLDTLKLLYQNGMSEKATLFNIAAYISFVSYGLLLAFTFLFFRKHRDIKDFSSYYFGYNIIATPIIVFLLIKIDLPSINIMSIIVVAVFKVLFYLIMLRYFMVSERVKKTFTRGNDENDNSFVIALLLGIAAISVASILYANASDNYTLTYDQNATSKGQVSTEIATIEDIPRPTTDNSMPAENYKFTSKNSIVQDYDSGLMWQDNTDAKTIERDWQGAKEYCQNLNFAGHSDWRLPRQEELNTVVDRINFPPTLKLKFQNIVIPAHYWSSTSNIMPGGAEGAWGVFFDKNLLESNDFRSHIGYVRCVRDNK